MYSMFDFLYYTHRTWNTLRVKKEITYSGVIFKFTTCSYALKLATKTTYTTNINKTEHAFNNIILLSNIIMLTKLHIRNQQ